LSGGKPPFLTYETFKRERDDRCLRGFQQADAITQA
jgi:hypothetical protein